jgi:hypothetical protein
MTDPDPYYLSKKLKKKWQYFNILMIYYRYPFNNILFSMSKNIFRKDPDLNLIGLPDPLFMITDPQIGSGSERNIYVFTTLRLTKVR